MGVNEKMTNLANAVRSKSGIKENLTIVAMTDAIEKLPVSGGKVVLPDDVTVEGSVLLKGYTAINSDGETVDGLIETVTPHVSNNVFSVEKGYVSTSFSQTIPETEITINGLEVNISQGYSSGKKVEVTLPETTFNKEDLKKGCKALDNKGNLVDGDMPDSTYKWVDFEGVGDDSSSQKAVLSKGFVSEGTQISAPMANKTYSEQNVLTKIDAGWINNSVTVKNFTTDADVESYDVAPGKIFYNANGRQVGNMPESELLLTVGFNPTNLAFYVFSGRTGGYVAGNTESGMPTYYPLTDLGITLQDRKEYTPTTDDQIIESGCYIHGNQVILGDANLIAENIKKGVTIFGVKGTYEGDGSSSSSSSSESPSSSSSSSSESPSSSSSSSSESPSSSSSSSSSSTPFTIYRTAEESGDVEVTLTFDGYIEGDYNNNISYRYSDDEVWEEIKITYDNMATSWILTEAKPKIQFKNKSNTFSTSSDNCFYFSATGNIGCEGNIQSLLNDSESCSSYCFYRLFANCKYLTEANGLIFPATTLANSCYQYMFHNCVNLTKSPAILPVSTLAESCCEAMFNGCTSLTTAPELPSTTLDKRCYAFMFSGCTSLTTAHELPSTTLAECCYEAMFNGCTSLTIAPELKATELYAWCYASMFSGCTSLTTAPELKATTLAERCYSSMFSGCTSLITVPELPATTLTQYCYHHMFDGCTHLTDLSGLKLPATTLADNDYDEYDDAEGCYAFMFSGCTSLTKAPELPATVLAYDCYEHMFSGCTSLKTAPELKATKLAYGCYANMFSGCTSLKTAPELKATKLAYGCYANMFSGCTSLTEAPELSATTLTNGCYNSMFCNCSCLNYIKVGFTSWGDETGNWVSGVSSKGTFVCPEGLPNETRGDNTIPENWGVVIERYAKVLSYIPNGYVDEYITGFDVTIQVQDGSTKIFKECSNCDKLTFSVDSKTQYLDITNPFKRVYVCSPENETFSYKIYCFGTGDNRNWKIVYVTNNNGDETEEIRGSFVSKGFMEQDRNNPVVGAILVDIVKDDDTTEGSAIFVEDGTLLYQSQDEPCKLEIIACEAVKKTNGDGFSINTNKQYTITRTDIGLTKVIVGKIYIYDSENNVLIKQVSTTNNN